MSDKTTVATSSGLGLGTVLLIIFACGKIFGFGPFQSWSWLTIIFLPILIDIGVVIALMLIMLIVAFIIWSHR